VRQAIHLLLGWTAQGHAAMVDRRVEEFTLPRFVGADVLGARPRLASTETWRAASVLADFALSGRLLRGLPCPSLPGSD
jgi:hypothetical protein